MNINKILSTELGLAEVHTANIIELIDQGNTIPFIARYRKEMTGACDDQVLRTFAERLEYLRKFEARKNTIIESLTELGVMTPEISASLEQAITLTELEDIYRPFKPKKKTRATVAAAKGLKPLADIILEQNPNQSDINVVAQSFVNPEKEVNSVEEALSGALDIICETMSDNAAVRKALRELIYDKGDISTTLITSETENNRRAVYEMYKEYSEPLKTIPSHRILAINRGENEKCLNVKIVLSLEEALEVIYKFFVKDAPTSNMVKDAALDAYNRLIFPSIEREIRADMFEKASEQAIKMFELNLRPLILQPALKNKVTMGVDPAYRTGCKIAVIDGYGNVMDKTVVFPTPPQSKIEESKEVLKKLIKKHNVEMLSIGNGTASKETEYFVAELINEMTDYKLSYAIVNEAGASVYSASKLGAEEFPDLEPAHRSAVSIARRLQDPMAELVKIEPRSIGVGQYQHDMPAAKLNTALQGTVEDCVNSVGVDANTASYALMSYIAGLNNSIAKNIVSYREKNGRFKNRNELLKVSKLGEKAFLQCAGFLRIIGGENILDNTAVHPESYPAANKLLELFKLEINNTESIRKLPDLVKTYGENKTADYCGVGVPTLNDIILEIMKPGRDIRDSLPPPLLRRDILSIDDLKEGMEITGTVRNVIDFGVFVDIGVHQDGLVHISEITDTYIKHPSEVLSVGEIVKVRVLNVDKAKNRISLTMKDGNNIKKDFTRSPKNTTQNTKSNASPKNNNHIQNYSSSKNMPAEKTERPKTLEESLQMLAAKFNKH